MRILFISNSFTMPLGPAYISSVLKKAGHETFAINFFSEPFNEDYLKNKLAEVKPDIIALCSVSAHTENQILKTAEWAKNHSDAFVVAGGVAATLTPERYIQDKNIDSACIGEGEEPMLELANNIEKRQDISKIKNLWVKENGKITKNENRPLLQELDSLPFPDWDLFKPGLERFVIISGRGCPFKCTNCVNHTLQKLFASGGKFVRRRSPENVIGEIKEAKRRYHPKGFWFYDETFTLDINWIKRFCSLYKKENINIPFSVNAHPLTITDEILTALKDAGLNLIRVGIESGDENIRKNILKRDISDERLNNALSLLKKHQIRIVSYNMMGLPDETKETVFKTIILNFKLNPDYTFFTFFQPFPKLELSSYCKRKKLIRRNITGIPSLEAAPSIETGHLNINQIEKLHNLAIFLFRLKKVHPHVFDFLSRLSEKQLRLIMNFLYYTLLEFKIIPLLYKLIYFERKSQLEVEV